MTTYDTPYDGADTLAAEIIAECRAEIDRLRCSMVEQRLCKPPVACSTPAAGFTLTPEEREAIKVAERDYADNDMDAGCYRIAATLRGLLSRDPPLSGAGQSTDGDNQQAADDAPPAWTQRPFLVDPPQGWLYGFPRRYDPTSDGDMTEWMIANGYPESLARKGLSCTFSEIPTDD